MAEDLKLDAVDKKILSLLASDARMSFREIAEKLKISHSTAFFRVNKMKQSGVLKGFAPIIDFGKLGFEVTVAIAAKVKGGHLEEVEKEVAKNPQVLAVYDVTGEWDMLIIAKFASMPDLNSFVKNLLSINYVERTRTDTVLNAVKENFFVPLGELKGWLK